MDILFIFICHRQCAISSMHCSSKYVVCCVFCAAQRWLYCIFYLNDCLWYRVIFFVYIWFDSFQAYFDSFHSIRNSNHENHVNTNTKKELGGNRKEKKVEKNVKWRLLDQYCLFPFLWLPPPRSDPRTINYCTKWFWKS